MLHSLFLQLVAAMSWKTAFVQVFGYSAAPTQIEVYLNKTALTNDVYRGMSASEILKNCWLS